MSEIFYFLITPNHFTNYIYSYYFISSKYTSQLSKMTQFFSFHVTNYIANKIPTLEQKFSVLK